MMKQLSCRPVSTNIVGFLVLLLMILQFRPSMSQEVEDQRTFDYLEGSSRGPKYWGSLRPDWDACSNGTRQSPIDLLHEQVQLAPELGIIKEDYRSASAKLKNRGHDIMLQWMSPAGHIIIDRTVYYLQQCHWHTPSEHLIDGQRFDMELHMVHTSSNGKIAVIGILYRIGRPDPFLSELEKKIWDLMTQNETMVGMVNPKDIQMDGRKYFRYSGSLTTPPCTEGVTWTIIKTVKTASIRQVQLLRIAFHNQNNARPVQALNDRVIRLYDPKCKTSFCDV